MEAGIGGGEDGADGFLVEAFVTLAALEVFEVAADRTFAEEASVLVGGDDVAFEEAIGALFVDGPAFAGGEGLVEEGEAGEGGHCVDLGLGFEGLAEAFEIELGFEVVHSGSEDGFAVEADPEADGVGTREVWKGLSGEILRGFIGGEVEVGEDDDAGGGVFEDLRAPAGLFAGVEAFAELEPEGLENPHEAGEETARASEGVMIVVGPAEAEAVLAGFLDLSGSVAGLPVMAFGFEDEMTGEVWRARELDDAIEGLIGGVEA